jgi:DinB superfamily
MPETLASALNDVIAKELAALENFPDMRAERKIGDAWSPQEELGHLIDSAINNHVRFVRAAIEPRMEGPGYAQDDWVRLHGYQDWPWPEVIAAWDSQNRQLAEVIRRIPESALANICVVGNEKPVTLRFLIEDYIVHMQHHLDHLLGREKITQYPQTT